MPRLTHGWGGTPHWRMNRDTRGKWQPLYFLEGYLQPVCKDIIHKVINTHMYTKQAHTLMNLSIITVLSLGLQLNWTIDPFTATSGVFHTLICFNNDHEGHGHMSIQRWWHGLLMSKNGTAICSLTFSTGNKVCRRRIVKMPVPMKTIRWWIRDDSGCSEEVMPWW